LLESAVANLTGSDYDYENVYASIEVNCSDSIRAISGLSKNEENK